MRAKLLCDGFKGDMQKTLEDAISHTADTKTKVSDKQLVDLFASARDAG